MDARAQRLDVSDGEVYARHAAELVRFATVLTGPSGADDLVADAVLRAFRSPGWPHVRNQRAYLYRAVLNAAHSAHRAETRRLRRERRAAVGAAVTAESHPEVRPEVLAAMRALDTRQRAIVFLTYWHDHTTAEIADELDLTLRTVQRELVAARRRLEELLR